MKSTVSLLAALCLAAGSAFAQAPKDDKAAARTEMREKMRAAHDKAEQACKGKAGAEHRDCMTREMCAQSKDPKACETRAKERQARRAQVREACKEKKGDDLKACLREHRSKK